MKIPFIAFIVMVVLYGCDSHTCGYYTRHVERFDRCIDSPACTLTKAEFYDYNVAVMRREAACKQ